MDDKEVQDIRKRLDAIEAQSSMQMAQLHGQPPTVMPQPQPVSMAELDQVAASSQPPAFDPMLYPQVGSMPAVTAAHFAQQPQPGGQERAAAPSSGESGGGDTDDVRARIDAIEALLMQQLQGPAAPVPSVGSF